MKTKLISAFIAVIMAVSVFALPASAQAMELINVEEEKDIISENTDQLLKWAYNYYILFKPDDEEAYGETRPDITRDDVGDFQEENLFPVYSGGASIFEWCKPENNTKDYFINAISSENHIVWQYQHIINDYVVDITFNVIDSEIVFVSCGSGKLAEFNKSIKDGLTIVLGNKYINNDYLLTYLSGSISVVVFDSQGTAIGICPLDNRYEYALYDYSQVAQVEAERQEELARMVEEAGGEIIYTGLPTLALEKCSTLSVTAPSSTGSTAFTVIAVAMLIAAVVIFSLNLKKKKN